MLDTKAINFERISVHYVGSQVNDPTIMISESDLPVLHDDLKKSLKKYFFGQFKVPEFYAFSDVTERPSALYKIVEQVFDNPDQIHHHSKSIAEHLYNQSIHPKIKSGELVVVYFEDLVVEDEMVNGIGIFKSESKDAFIKLLLRSNTYDIQLDKGINVNKVDKGVLIFNTDKSQGYKMLVTDSKRLNGEAQFWINDFIGCEMRKDEFNSTTVYIQATKAFIEDQLADGAYEDKSDSYKALDASKDYFESKENFDEKEYLESVFHDEEVIDAFNEFKSNRQLNLLNNFDISEPAVKRHSNVYKSVIKLDKNFHIYVHGNREMIKRGQDEDGRKFYKIYYEEEHS